MRYLLIIVINILLLQSSFSQQEPVLRIGLVADPQYADKAANNSRYYRESLWKLEEAIDTFNYYGVDFVQTLGDVIDLVWESYDSILPLYDKLAPGIENYQLLGNHDFSVDSCHLEDLLERLDMPDYYYSHSEKGWRFIVLDATDYSYFSNALHNHDIGQVDSFYQHTRDKANHHLWNGAIGEEQQIWLRQELVSANTLNQRVILFSHLPVIPLSNAHNLWNDYEIVELLEASPHVVTFINGHNPSGGYVSKKGIHYITIYGMVETMTSSYGILEIYKDSLVLRGYGNQTTYHIK